MATTADQRLLELLEKWLHSLELHQQYAALDDAAYWQVQAWQPHQRPNRWIIDLAKQKTAALRAQVEERIGAGDRTFSESLEMMIFLANLVGSQHIERFIPLAGGDAAQTPRGPLDLALAMSDQSPTAKEPVLAAGAAESLAAAPAAAPASLQTAADGDAALDATATREMPQFGAAAARAAPPGGERRVARMERRAATALRPLARPAAKPARGPAVKSARPPAPAAAPATGAPAAAAPAEAAASAGATDAARNLVMADAARLMQWGRNWFELPELIARMADRPALPEVRRILNDSKAAIDEMARRR